VRIALHNAFWQLHRNADYEEALIDTVMRGGDTDTNGAIVGALLGALRGRRGIPARWWQRVVTCRPLVGAGAKQPRSAEFWPVDALALAEALLRMRIDAAAR
jgi:hypothetical protein